MYPAQAYDEIIDFMADCNPQRVSKFTASEETKARVGYLIAQSKTTSLTDEETHELDSYMLLEHLMRMAKARAMHILAVQKRI